MLGLVMTAGGARGAYQAGVLKRIGEIPSLQGRASPFKIIAGSSAGAINGATLAAGSLDLNASTRRLADLWAGIEARNVIVLDPLSLGWNSLQMLKDLSLGGLLGRAGTRSLLDASPLRKYLERHLAMAGVGEAIAKGALYAVAISATSYHSGRCFTFIEGQEGHPVWQKRRRVTVPTTLTVDHVMASAAIPLVFQPVPVQTARGRLYFGDGALRLVNPLSPAIRLGATKLLAIGVRCQEAADELHRAELEADEESSLQPPLAQICGVFMNAIFLDHLDSDIDHLLRMNELVRTGRAGMDSDVNEPIREIEPLVINPSEDLALIARSYIDRIPRGLRYLLEGLGTPNAQSADLISFLLFDGSYTRDLVEIGYRDANAQIEEIEELLATPTEGQPASLAGAASS